MRPPSSLSEPERQAFVDLVSSVPSSQFAASDLPLLCRFVELQILAEQAAGELRVGSGSIITRDGKVSPWFAIHQQCTKAMLGLTLRLRLAPQSRVAKASRRRQLCCGG